MRARGADVKHRDVPGETWRAACGLAAAWLCALALAAGQGSAAEAPAAAAPADITFVDDGEGTEGRDDAGQGPRSPFAADEAAGPRSDAVPGCVELSNGAKVAGRIFTTRAKRLKVYNLERKVYEYVPVPACRRIEALVEWERLDKEWRFKEAGSPEKVYTGREYPARMLAWRLTLRNGHQVTGHILGQPLYVAEGRRTQRFVLHERDKGAMGAGLADLVYVRRVDLGREAFEAAGGRGGAPSGPAAPRRDAGGRP